jgi:hypothetical protein
MVPYIYQELEKFEQLGWDFDGTLIDSEASPLLWKFILDHPKIKHVIVTFRTDHMLTTLWRELAAEGGPQKEAFSGLLSVPYRIWEDHAHIEYNRRRGLITGPVMPEEDLYWEWKGLTCSEHGLPVLIDDNFPHTKPGCDRYGIRLIHPDEFLNPVRL